MHANGLMSWFEQLDGIAVRVFQQDLLAAGANFHLIAKMEPRLLESFDAGRKVSHLQYHAVPSARFLMLSTGHGRDPDAPGPLRISFRLPFDTWANAGRFL